MTLPPAYGFVGSAGGGVTDHGALTGLTGDHHTTYHNDGRAAAWLAANHETTFDHPGYTAHLADVDIHRLINDAGITATDLYSAERILALLAGYAPTGHTHALVSPHLQPFPYVQSGRRYSPGMTSEDRTSIAGAAGRLDVMLLRPGRDFAISEAHIEVTTGVASALARIVAYSSAASGLPNTLLWNSADLDCSSAGEKSHTQSYTFLRGVQYWIGIHQSSTAQFRADVAGTYPCFEASGSNQGPRVIYRATGQTFASGAPSPFPAGTAVTASPVSIELSAA